ncbi:MAG: efflux RND transporter permease subunit [Bacteroidales bacterium]|nr:efflux RND transporter permease subunit [Bacteroidales bacterium]
MSVKDKIKSSVRNFQPTTLALQNKTTVFLLTAVILIFGAISYVNLPKELFPDITPPYIMVQTVYVGNTPEDIENLITRPLEKEIESVKGIKYMNSTSSQDVSMIFIEFNTNVEIKEAKQNIRDAIDKAMGNLPNDLTSDPIAQEIDFSEFPILNINMYGDYSLEELKRYAEILEEQIEPVSEVSKVNIQGITEKEVKIDIDVNQMMARQISFNDIQGAIGNENISMSAGEAIIDSSRYSIRIIGEFETLQEFEKTIIKHENGDIVYLRDILKSPIALSYEETTSITRLEGHPVVSLQVVKKGGENLLSATEQIHAIIAKAQKDNLIPKDLSIQVTNDQSETIKMQLSNLENSMLISMIFVIVILFFFLGTRNALIVGLAIPLSMFLTFIVFGMIGYRINMIVLFSLILALGMLVDNAIVVVENIYRFIDLGYSKLEAAKQAAGEIAIPIIASTATTLAAFLPLAFWDSMVGDFMSFLPITLIIVLVSSLFVALIIVPVFSSNLIKKEQSKPKLFRGLVLSAIIGLVALLASQKLLVGLNIFLLGVILTVLNRYLLDRVSNWFQNTLLVKLESFYQRFLRFALLGKTPFIFMAGTVILLIVTISIYFASSPKVEFFPDNDPSYINIEVELPIGTDIRVTDNFMKTFEADVIRLLGQDTVVVESVLTNVGSGAQGDSRVSAGGNQLPNKGMVTLSFVDYEDRSGINTTDIMGKMQDSLTNKYPGVLVTISKNSMGPPTGKPINIEVSGDDYPTLIKYSRLLKQLIDESGIEGIEELKIDLETGKQELLIHIDRDKARRFGLSSIQIAATIRTALFGNEVSDFKVGEDEYPIMIRMDEESRNSIENLMNQKITFRNTRGKIMQVPISSVAQVEYSTTYGAIKRKDMKRMITLYSNVVEGYNANEINAQLKDLITYYDTPEEFQACNVSFTGEQQDQQESMDFMTRALMIAISLIMLILVSQFNSLVKPFIILASILFSTIGVFGGLAIFNMNFIVVMTGIGIISLAGVVVNNAIVLIDYIDLLKKRKREELGLNENEKLSIDEATNCVVEAGKTRLRPVLLTAITTILGLFPMALGMNIDFNGLITRYQPNIYFGGDMVHMWAPLSWTVIFGLSFATFLTLVIVPVMYRIAIRSKDWVLDTYGKYKNKI